MEIKKEISFPLDVEKSLAIAQNILNRLEDKEANFMYLLKLIFFADRYHFRKYLRPSTSDKYFAMKRGAVASYLYDIFKNGTNDERIKKIGDYTVQLTGEPQYQEKLSQSDIEAIDFSFNNFGKYSDMVLSDICHAYPEWKKFEKELNSRDGRKSILMDMRDFLEDADPEDNIFRKNKMSDPFEPIPKEEKEILETQLVEIHSQIA